MILSAACIISSDSMTAMEHGLGNATAGHLLMGVQCISQKRHFAHGAALV